MYEGARDTWAVEREVREKRVRRSHPVLLKDDSYADHSFVGG